MHDFTWALFFPLVMEVHTYTKNVLSLVPWAQLFCSYFIFQMGSCTFSWVALHHDPPHPPPE
jgi:hypothetical protein